MPSESERIYIVYPCTWWRDTIAWQWEGYNDTTPAGCIAEAVTCGDSRVTIDDVFHPANVFVDGRTGDRIEWDAPPPVL